MACGDFKHPLQRGGTNQAERQLPGLQPNYVLPDEKTTADWITFTNALAAFIRYYDTTNTPNGNWRQFFAQDVSSMLAFVAVQDPDALSRVNGYLSALRADTNQGNLSLLQTDFAALFAAGLAFSKALDDQLARLPDGISLKLVIAGLVKSKLAPMLNRLLSYYKAAANPSDLLLNETDIPDWSILGQLVQKPATVLAAGLSQNWITTNAADWPAYYEAITADPTIFGDTTQPAAKQIRLSANHNLFLMIFGQYTMAYARILKEGSASLEATLDQWQHPPHYALFLTFLKLLGSAQARINRFTGRHLDFYYGTVLQLSPQPPVPDTAHVVIELAKSQDEFMLPKGALFRGGKDTAGQNVLYALQADSVFNQAAVAKLMAFYEAGLKDNIPGGAVNAGHLFAAPVINSADGLGAKLTSAQGEWHPFVNRTYADGVLKSINEPLASIGFAVASHYLALAEGDRSVFIRLATSPNHDLKGEDFDVYLTTAKGWWLVPVAHLSPGVFQDKHTKCAQINFALVPTDPPVVNYDSAVHGGTLDATTPVAKILLRNTTDRACHYEKYRELSVARVEVEVNVGASDGSKTGVKQLLLASGAGSLDPSKPFLPFGSQPVADDVFIIGSHEVFSKANAQINFTVKWIKLPSDANAIAFIANSQSSNPQPPVLFGPEFGTGTKFFQGVAGIGISNIIINPASPPQISLEYLEGGSWQAGTGAGDGAIDIFSGVTPEVTFPASWDGLPSGARVDYTEPLSPYTIQSPGGFLRFVLNSGFGQADYLAAQTLYLIGQANQTGTGSAPTPPYTPTLESLAINYTAAGVADLTTNTQAAFEARVVRFFHIYPFGDAEQHAHLNGGQSLYLLPQFRYVESPTDPDAVPGETSVPLNNQGEFYVGFSNLTAGQSVSILFQVLEGSTNPLLSKPADHVYFSYLTNNAWKPIRRNLVSDSTLQLIQSGLIQLAIPEDATTTNTMLPGGYVWLRLSVAELVDEVCELLAVLPQAAAVTYQATPQNAPGFVNTPLPAGTIAKLQIPAGAVKQIQQPYPSFGGALQESTAAFNTRVSERLRHKDRAITIWDFERLTLQAFPQIHKVKCLSHTKLIPDPNDSSSLIYSELAPGCVTVVAIPDLTQRNDANPLRPYTSADVLAQIQAYLENRATGLAQILAINPFFEEMRLEFTVNLLQGYLDAAYYGNLLATEITRFLSPWAYGGTADIQFGGKVYKSSLVDFIEQRPYVDSLVDVKLYHTAGDSAVESGDEEEVVASTARSVLVSAPVDRHKITVQLWQDPGKIAEQCQADD